MSMGSFLYLLPRFYNLEALVCMGCRCKRWNKSKHDHIILAFSLHKTNMCAHKVSKCSALSMICLLKQWMVDGNIFCLQSQMRYWVCVHLFCIGPVHAYSFYTLPSLFLISFPLSLCPFYNSFTFVYIFIVSDIL